MYCKYYKGRLKCPAYPDGVPDEVFSGPANHIEPYKQDNEIVFEPLPGMEEDAQELFGWQPPE